MRENHRCDLPARWLTLKPATENYCDTPPSSLPSRFGVSGGPHLPDADEGQPDRRHSDDHRQPEHGNAVGQDLLIQRVAGTNFKVLDNAATPINYGTFTVTNGLRLNLTSFTTDINIDLNAGVLPGSVTIDLGNGDADAIAPGMLAPHPVSIYDGSGMNTGTINGGVTVLRGSGQEVVALGQIGPLDTNPTAHAIHINGGVTATASTQGGFAGNSLFVGPGTVVNGSVSDTQYSQMTVGAFGFTGGQVGGSLTVNLTNSPIGASVVVLGFVGGNLSVSGSNNGDFVAVRDPNPGGAGDVPGSIGGSFSVNLGSGFNLVDMDPATFVGKSFSVTAGNGTTLFGSPIFGFGGTVGGSMTLNFGNGPNTILFGGTALIGGSLNLTVGNGANSIDLNGTVAGSVTATTGNGTNTFTVDTGAQLLGPVVNFKGGTGSNTVTIANAVNSFALHVTFTNGTRSST